MDTIFKNGVPNVIDDPSIRASWLHGNDNDLKVEICFIDGSRKSLKVDLKNNYEKIIKIKSCPFT